MREFKPSLAYPLRAVQCRAPVKNGDEVGRRCKKKAILGGLVCRSHGAQLPAVREAAARAVEEAGWAFLPTGRAFVTRTGKRAGGFWLVWKPRSGTRGHRRLLGLLAPESTIKSAVLAAADTETARASRREVGARSRERQEARYQQQLTAAIVDYLAFAPEHQDLAHTIARQAAEHAAVVGSGRVARTRMLPLQERAALAARAQIRHANTDYEQQLRNKVGERVDDESYRAIKAEGHADVDAFLRAHRADAT